MALCQIFYIRTHTQTVYANDIQVDLTGEVRPTELCNKCHKNQVKRLQVNFVRLLFVTETLADAV